MNCYAWTNCLVLASGVDILSILILQYNTGLPNIDNGAYGTENLLLKTQVSEDFHSEMNIIT